MEFCKLLPEHHAEQAFTAVKFACIRRATVLDAVNLLSQYEANSTFAVDKALAKSVSLGPFCEGMMTKPHPLKAFEAHRLVFADIQKNMASQKYNCREFFESNFYKVRFNVFHQTISHNLDSGK